MRRLLSSNSRQWPLLGQALVATIGLVGATLAARILGPQIYGEYFLGLTVVSLVGIGADLCVGQAILTRSPGYAVAWKSWRLVSVTIATTAALCTLIATISFWHRLDQSIMWILLCSGIPITIASMVPRAFLVLAGQLRTVALVDVVSIFFANSVMLALVFAYTNLAAAAAGQLVIAGIRLCALEFAKRNVDLDTQTQRSMNWSEAFTSLWQSVSGIYQSQLSGFLARNGDNLIVSAVLGPIQLAQYSRAYSLLLGPLQQAQMALTPMTLRDLAHSSNEVQRHQEGSKAAKLLLILMLPITGAVAVCGERLVRLILGPDWEPAASLMAASAGLAISMTVALPARWILIAERNHLRLRIDSAMQFATLIGVFAGSVWWGLQGSMWVNAVVVGPLAAIVAWCLLDYQYRLLFLRMILPLAIILTGLPALTTAILDSLVSSDINFIAASFAVATLTTIAANVLLLRRLR